MAKVKPNSPPEGLANPTEPESGGGGITLLQNGLGASPLSV